MSHLLCSSHTVRRRPSRLCPNDIYVTDGEFIRTLNFNKFIHTTIFCCYATIFN